MLYLIGMFCAGIFVIVCALLNQLSAMDKRQEQVYNLMKSLGIRVVRLEGKKLEEPGLFIHEDLARKLGEIYLSLLSEEHRDQIYQSYQESELPDIPFWKYLLYNYPLNIAMIPDMETNLEHTFEQYRQFQSNYQMMSQCVNSVNDGGIPLTNTDLEVLNQTTPVVASETAPENAGHAVEADLANKEKILAEMLQTQYVNPA